MTLSQRLHAAGYTHRRAPYGRVATEVMRGPKVVYRGPAEGIERALGLVEARAKQQSLFGGAA